MNIWIVLWAFLATFLLGITIWSFQILVRQRSTWIQFAKKHNLECHLRGFLKSPVIKGVYDGRLITLYSDKELVQDNQGGKFRTLLQFDLAPAAPVEGIIASPGVRSYALALGLPREITPDTPDWNKGIVIRTQNENLLKPYLTPERLQMLNNLLSLKNTNTLFIFNETESFIRFETADPFDNISKMEKQLSKIIEATKKLEG